MPKVTIPHVGKTWRSRRWTRLLPPRFLWWLLNKANPTILEWEHRNDETLLHRLLMYEVK